MKYILNTFVMEYEFVDNSCPGVLLNANLFISGDVFPRLGSVINPEAEQQTISRGRILLKTPCNMFSTEASHHTEIRHYLL